LALAREAEDRFYVWLLLRNLGQATRASGDHPRALAYYEEAYAVAQEFGDRGRGALIDTLGLMGELAVRTGNLERGSKLFREVLAMWRRDDYMADKANALSGLGWIAVIEGNTLEAAVKLSEGLALFWEQRDKTGVAELLLRISAAALSGGCPEQAARLHGAGTALMETSGYVLAPADREPYDQICAAAKKALGADAFTIAWEAGRALQIDDAVNEAQDFAAALTVEDVGV
jgi:tetratricopeptide (TPR) repeat protein